MKILVTSSNKHVLGDPAANLSLWWATSYLRLGKRVPLENSYEMWKDNVAEPQ